MSQVICVKNGGIAVDLDALADHLSMTTSQLKLSMQLLALSYLMNEAERLNAGEHFDKKTQTYPYPPIRDGHLVSAAKSMLRPPVLDN